MLAHNFWLLLAGPIKLWWWYVPHGPHHSALNVTYIRWYYVKIKSQIPNAKPQFTIEDVQVATQIIS